MNKHLSGSQLSCGDVEEKTVCVPGRNGSADYRDTMCVRLWKESLGGQGYHVRLTDFSSVNRARIFWVSFLTISRARKLFDKVSRDMESGKTSEAILNGLVESKAFQCANILD